MNSPSVTSSVMPSTAVTSPNRLVTSSKVTPLTADSCPLHAVRALVAPIYVSGERRQSRTAPGGARVTELNYW